MRERREESRDQSLGRLETLRTRVNTAFAQYNSQLFRTRELTGFQPSAPLFDRFETSFVNTVTSKLEAGERKVLAVLREVGMTFSAREQSGSTRA